MSVFNEVISPGLNGIIISLLLLFFVLKDRVLDRQIIKRFRVVAVLLFLMTILAMLDIYFKKNSHLNLELLHSFIVFARVATVPFIALAFVGIYGRNYSVAWQRILFLPLIVHVSACFYIYMTSPHSYIGDYIRVGFTLIEWLTFIVGVVYGIVGFVFIMLASVRKPNRRNERSFFIAIVLVILGAGIYKCISNVEFWYWTTVTICVFAYLFLLTYEKLIYDQLTKAYTRVIFEKDLVKYRRKENIVLAMIDLNNLKMINDTMGHKYGDMAIVNVTTSVFHQVSLKDKLYRYGGDEFILISKHTKAEELKEQLQRAQKECDDVINVKTEFAYAVVKHIKNSDIRITIKKADQLMYKNKEVMKNGSKK